MSQDGYVPYHSARIELCQASSSDYSKKGKIFLEMLNDCLDQIRAPSSEHRVFMRCDVNFDTSSQGRNLNTLIGRAAHIEFLETDAFARFVMWSFPELFRWESEYLDRLHSSHQLLSLSPAKPFWHPTLSRWWISVDWLFVARFYNAKAKSWFARVGDMKKHCALDLLLAAQALRFELWKPSAALIEMPRE